MAASTTPRSAEAASCSDPADLLRSPWGSVGRGITFGLVAGFSKLILSCLNATVIVNEDAFVRAVAEREPNTGLLTVSNHTSMFDDPGVLSAMVPWRYFWFDPLGEYIRWSLCAREVCFKNEFLRQFFLSGKTLPVARGEGVKQPAMEAASIALGQGHWVHLFPEGKINYSGKLGPLRWGSGKLVCDAHVQSGGRDPIVLPFYHSGMGRVLPNGAHGFGVGMQVDVRVGEPVPLADLTCRCGQVSGEEQRKLWMQITQRMADALTKLEQESPPNVSQERPKAA